MGKSECFYCIADPKKGLHEVCSSRKMVLEHKNCNECLTLVIFFHGSPEVVIKPGIRKEFL